MDPDRSLDKCAARQYGVFSRKQAVRAGLTSKMIHTRLASGAWIRLAPSVFAMASAPPKWERQLAAALLSRDGSIAAGASAAFLHEFEGFTAGRPVIMVNAEGNARSPLAALIRSHRFGSIGRVRRRGFLVTDEAETILTLSSRMPVERIEALVDYVLARRSSTVDEITQVVANNPGARGVAKLRPVVEHRSATAYQPPTSELERLLYRVLDDPRLPSYTRQMPMSYQSVNATVDAYIPYWRLIVEGDGRRWHTRKADYDRDRLRDNEATAHGYAVLRFTYEALRYETERCTRTLLRTGRVRSAS